MKIFTAFSNTVHYYIYNTEVIVYAINIQIGLTKECNGFGNKKTFPPKDWNRTF